MPITMQFVHEIQARPEEVYAAMADMDAWKEWMKGLVRIEPLTEGEFGVGTKWREVRKMMGHEAAEVFEVRAAQPGKSLELYVDGKLGSSKKGEYIFVYSFDPTATGMRLVTNGKVDMGGGFADLMCKLFSGTFKKAINEDLNAMKQYIETKGAGEPR